MSEHSLNRKRAVVLCPGRGSYTASELGYLSRPTSSAARETIDAAVDRADSLRTARGDLTIREIDGARKFKQKFGRGENASALTFACGAFDFLSLDSEKVEVVAVGGNSMGWYTALYAAGVLDIDNTFDLVEIMGGMTRDGQIGGQVIYPAVDDDWHRASDREQTIRAALTAADDAGHAAGHSIHYGGFEVLWAHPEGVEFLLNNLPKVELGEREYPLQLPGHSAFHSPLMQEVSDQALEQLHDLPWQSPALPIIDGRGHQWRPLTSRPQGIYEYTLHTQVTTTFDFSATVRIALREYAPDYLVLLGPGEALGSAVAQVMIEERWQKIASRSVFLDRQQIDPPVISMARPEQATLVVSDAS